MKNSELAKEFVEGRCWEGKKEGSNMFIDGHAIYSYGYHFPIAIKLEDNNFIFTSAGYSSTTSRHKNYVKSAIENARGTIHILSLSEMQDIIGKGIFTLKELMVNKIIK